MTRAAARQRRLFPASKGDDNQLNLLGGGHAELPAGGQRDYFA
jgi:hypothetical protein